MLPALLVALVVVAGFMWVRARLAAADRARVDLEVFRVGLGVPAARLRVVDIGLVDGLLDLLPARRVPLFARVHAVRAREAVSV